jgi:hypothetical protein
MHENIAEHHCRTLERIVVDTFQRPEAECVGELVARIKAKGRRRLLEARLIFSLFIEHVTRMRKTVLWITVAALLNGGLAVIGRGGVIHTLSVLAVGIYIGLPALIVVGCGFGFGDRFAWVRKMGRIALVVLVLTESLFISLIPGRILLKHDIAAAKTYCESLIPVIDKYRREHGVYPSVLGTVQQNREVPRLLRDRVFYWSDGKVYGFDFSDPRGFMNFVGYRSETRNWFNWH